MKLCVLRNKIDEKFLYSEFDLFLYYLPINEYKKQILKGNVCTDVINNALVCVLYARNVVKGRFVIGEDMISMSAIHSLCYAVELTKGRFLLGVRKIKQSWWYTLDYENYFDITL